ncbi:unnamed protein product [Arabidopsis thaliana]|uniref:Fatty acyl-CoA reductase n=1 Tax=Arabidopsis thaliana TaxID=3702 RepID=A0A5S9Y6I4_ARATH|nr:unnamed protein product [Arabidopsis thaliana]
MEPNCVQFLENRTILVTGASGVLAKVLVERILRLQPNVKRLYLLVRASDKKSAEQRYDVALGINTFGAINVLNFAKKCVKPKLLLHVSTAYVCGERPGHIVEKHFAMGESLNGKNKVDINTDRRLADQKSKQLKEQGCSGEETEQAMKDFGLKRARLYGWPNTYVFTKAMGEMLLGHYRETMPIVIIRPTIITSTFSDPFPGWIEGLKTVDSVIIFYGKGILKCFLVDQKTVCDIIPVDMVVNAMIAIAADHCHDSGSHTVYHVGSSNQNPVIYKQIYEMMSRYFMKSPLVGRNGMLIVPKVTTISTLARFRVYTNLRYKLPTQILGLLSVISPSQRDKFALHNRKFKMAMRLVKLYKPYVLFKGIFDDKNMETLRIKNEAKDMEKLFGTNPKCIDWEDYFMNTHIPGLMTHVFKK